MSANKILVPKSALLTALGATAFATSVSAQDTKNPLVLSFEGAVGTGDYANAYGEAKLGGGFNALDDDVAFVGSVGLSRAINDNWDWSLSVSRLGYAENGANDGSDDIGASWTSASNRSEAVFSLDRDLALGSASARLGLGLAYAKASNEKGLDVVSNNSSVFDSTTVTEFHGVGPNISLDVQSAPFLANDKLSVIGGIEASFLAGKYHHSKGLEAYDDDFPLQFAAQDSANGNMVTAGMKIGLQYIANESTAFRAGVRYDVTRMDNARASGSPTIDQVSVNDSRTSFFVGMDVSF